MSDLARIAAALEELAAIERERLSAERETRAARRAPRQRRDDVKPTPEQQRKAAAALRKIGARRVTRSA